MFIHFWPLFVHKTFPKERSSRRNMKFFDKVFHTVFMLVKNNEVMGHLKIEKKVQQKIEE